MRGRILWLLVGTLVVVGLVWSMPWLALSSGEVDAPEVEASKNQPEQDSTKDQAEQAATNDQPEQETMKDQPEDEKALEDTPPSKEEGVSNNLPPPSPLPPPVQPSTPRVEEVPQNFLSPNDYWYYDNPDYWYYEPEPDDWYYEPNYWDY